MRVHPNMAMKASKLQSLIKKALKKRKRKSISEKTQSYKTTKEKRSLHQKKNGKIITTHNKEEPTKHYLHNFRHKAATAAATATPHLMQRK